MAERRSRDERQEVFVSVDVETDGPIPGPHSMLSIGAVAFTEADGEIGRWTANLLPLPGAAPHPATADWWARQPAAAAAVAVDQQDPAEAVAAFAAWLDALPGWTICVAAPTGFDFTFVYWYLHRFLGRSPFGRESIDLRTVAWGLLGGDHHTIHKKTLKHHWPVQQAHTHIAIDDAAEQGELFMKVLAAMRGRAAQRGDSRS